MGKITENTVIHGFANGHLQGEGYSSVEDAIRDGCDCVEVWIEKTRTDVYQLTESGVVRVGN